MLKGFFERNAVRTSNVLKTSKGTANIIVIGRFESVSLALERMLPFLFKKSNEARYALDYYEGRIRGNDLIALFKEEVEAGRRERRPHKVRLDVPFRYPEGDALMKARRAEKIRQTIARTRAKVTRKDYEEIREKHFTLGNPLRELVKAYPQYGRETIRRILGRGRGSVLIVE